jgi:hypothetical protein
MENGNMELEKVNIKEDIQNLLVQIDSRLTLVEVKGESVQHLFSSRLMLKDVLEKIQSLELKEEQKEKEAD